MQDLNEAIQRAYKQVTDRTKITGVIAKDLKVSFSTVKGWLSAAIGTPERHQYRVLYILNNAVKLQAREFKDVAKDGEQILHEYERRAAQTS